MQREAHNAKQMTLSHQRPVSVGRQQLYTHIQFAGKLAVDRRAPAAQ